MKKKAQKTSKKIVVRLRLVPVHLVIRRALRKLDAAIAQFEREEISQSAIDEAYDVFTNAMRALRVKRK